MTTQRLHETTIENWMLSISQDGGVDRFDDLHIDQIDPSWGSRELWINAGLEAFRLALNLRDQHRLPLTVALAFSLESSAHPRGPDFGTAAGLRGLLDWSPPSLYLFPPGKEPWLQTARSGWIDSQSQDLIIQPMKASEVLGAAIRGAGYLLEFRQLASDEYSRTFFVAG